MRGDDVRRTAFLEGQFGVRVQVAAQGRDAVVQIRRCAHDGDVITVESQRWWYAAATSLSGFQRLQRAIDGAVENWLDRHNAGFAALDLQR